MGPSFLFFILFSFVLIALFVFVLLSVDQLKKIGRQFKWRQSMICLPGSAFVLVRITLKRTRVNRLERLRGEPLIESALTSQTPAGVHFGRDIPFRLEIKSTAFRSLGERFTHGRFYNDEGMSTNPTCRRAKLR